MKTNYLLVILGVLAILSACASQTSWTPTVDTYEDKNIDRLTQDQEECRDLAKQASNDTATEAAKGTGVGLIGAASGAVLGAIVGSPGTGAKIGAAAGGMGGATHSGLSAEEKYKHAFSNCLRGRGHKVVN